MNNLQMASALAEFVKFCLLNNEEFMRDNETKTISTSDVISQLEEIERNGIGREIPIIYTEDYRILRDKCSGCVSFTNEEIDNIAHFIEESVMTCGLPRNAFYFDVVDFTVDQLRVLLDYKKQTIDNAELLDSDYSRILNLRKCIQLDRTSLYYKPFAATICSGYPNCALRIVMDNETIYNIDTNSIVTVDRIGELSSMSKDMRHEESDDSIICAANVAADWWAKALTDPVFAIRYDCSASFINSILALKYSMVSSPNSEETINAFKSCLKDKVLDGMKKDGHYTIRAGVDLDESLRAAMNRAGVDDTGYSLGTVMNITPNEVTLTIGRGDSNKQVLYSSNREKYQKVRN